MRLLIVEDDQQFLEAELALLRPLLGDDEISVRNSRDSALKAIADEVFDYAVLDLKLPSDDEALDAAVEHGILVYERLKAVSPGTPVCFLTGFGSDDFISDRLDEARAVDIWGSGADKPMVRMLRKGRLAKLHGIIQEVKSEIQSLNDIEVISSTDLDSLESRVIRISGRRQRARSILVDPLSGGLSGMRVLKMTVRDQHGAKRHLCAARIGDRDEIRAEIVNYQQHIVNLPHGTYAVFTNEVSFGAGRLAGVFYELMPDLRSLLDVIRIDVSEGVRVIERLEQAESSWTQGRPQSQTTVVAIRRLLLSDESLERVKTQLAGLGYEAFEPKTLEVPLATQHGDLQAHLARSALSDLLEGVGQKQNAQATLNADLKELEATLDNVFQLTSRLISKTSKIDRSK